MRGHRPTGRGRDRLGREAGQRGLWDGGIRGDYPELHGSGPLLGGKHRPFSIARSPPILSLLSCSSEHSSLVLQGPAKKWEAELSSLLSGGSEPVAEAAEAVADKEVLPTS